MNGFNTDEMLKKLGKLDPVSYTHLDVYAHHQSGGGMNGFNTDEMLKKLGKLDPREFSPGAAPQASRCV
ncbi:protein traB [Klebsiella pneumoniae]|nr:protein traB [Klebsiella pneumoniae]